MDTDRCTKLHLWILPHQWGISWKPEEVFVTQSLDFRGQMDLHFGILSPLHPPVVNHSYITCCPSWFELGVCPAPQLAAGECLAPKQLIENLDYILKAKILFVECAWNEFSAVTVLACWLKEMPNRRSSRLGGTPLVKPGSIVQSFSPFQMSPLSSFLPMWKEDPKLSCWLLTLLWLCQWFFLLH